MKTTIGGGGAYFSPQEGEVYGRWKHIVPMSRKYNEGYIRRTINCNSQVIM